MWYVPFAMRMQSNWAENSITLTLYSSVNVFIALEWRLEMIMGFTYEYTYQDCEYITTMYTMHAQ